MNAETESNAGQLGTIVAWRVPSEVALDTLRVELANAGLSPDLAGDLHPRYVLSRALREMREGRVICRLQKVDADSVSFQLTKQLPHASSVDYVPETIVTLNLNTNAISAGDPAIADAARQLVAEHASKRLTNDLTRLIQSLFDAHKADLIPVREQGGCYFVPDKHSALVAQVRTFLASINGRLSSYAVKLGHGETSASVAESMTEYLGGLIREFRESCADVGSDSRKGVVDRRHERIADLRTRLESYRTLLGSFAGSIGANIDAAERELLEKLMPPKPAAESIGSMRELLGTQPPAGAAPTQTAPAHTDPEPEDQPAAPKPAAPARAERFAADRYQGHLQL
jgi:hypothetical protein